MLHDAGAEAGEQHHAENDKVVVILADGISARRVVVVRDGEELGRESAGLGQAEVGEEEEGDEVEGEACVCVDSSS